MGNSQSNDPDQEEEYDSNDDDDESSDYSYQDDDDDSGLYSGEDSSYSSDEDLQEDSDGDDDDDSEQIVDNHQEEEINGDGRDVELESKDTDGTSKEDATQEPLVEDTKGATTVSPLLVIPSVEDMTVLLQDMTPNLVEKISTRDAILQQVKSVQTIPLDNDFDLERYTEIAMELLDKAPKLRNVRFRLVPGRIKEHAFWATVFLLLQQSDSRVENNHDCNVLDHDKDHSNKPENKQNGETNEDATAETPQRSTNTHDAATMNGNSHSVPLSSTYGESFQQIMNGHASVSHIPDALQRQVKEKTWHILQLEQKLQQANDKIQQLTTKQQQQGSLQKDKDSSEQQQQQSRHAGEWKLSRDSQDFLALDVDLKENMRREKSRRIEMVKEEMKFILDSDHFKDSFGEWDCCHNQQYHSKGCVVDENDSKQNNANNAL